MIDTHVHLRDWEEAPKETLRHGLKIARELGFTGVFEMPNTAPPLLSRILIEKRLEDADQAIRAAGIEIFHGVYAGLTADGNQIAEMVRAAREIPRVVGLKMFTCASTGNLGITDPDDQGGVYDFLARLGYSGVLAVHCEKEAFFKPELWNPLKPETHGAVRPPEAETASVEDQIRFARDGGFTGNLHICHISVPDTLRLIEESRRRMPFAISCEAAPHHLLLWDGLLAQNDGICLKVNPPLRPKHMQEALLEALFNKRITCIGSDHAPHTLRDKRDKAASGLPSFLLYPVLFSVLKKQGAGDEVVSEMMSGNIRKLFNLPAAEVPGSLPPNTFTVQDFGYEAFPSEIFSGILKMYESA